MNNAHMKNLLGSLARLQPMNTIPAVLLSLIPLARPNPLAKKQPYLTTKIIEYEGSAHIGVKQQQYLGLHGIPAVRRGQRAVGKGQNDRLHSNWYVHHLNFCRRALLQPALVMTLGLAVTCRQCKICRLQTAIVMSRGFDPTGNPPPLQVPRPTLTDIGDR